MGTCCMLSGWKSYSRLEGGLILCLRMTPYSQMSVSITNTLSEAGGRVEVDESPGEQMWIFIVVTGTMSEFLSSVSILLDEPLKSSKWFLILPQKKGSLGYGKDGGCRNPSWRYRGTITDVIQNKTLFSWLHWST